MMKLERMACEICERHSEQTSLSICGLNQRGYFLAALLQTKIKGILPGLNTNLVQVDSNGDTPVFAPATDFAGKQVLLVDDVINTGYTLMKVMQHIFLQRPAGIETAFLAKREHRNFPVKADYVGLSLATTLQEHVQFDNQNQDGLFVYLS